MGNHMVSPVRQEALRALLPDATDLLHKNRAAEIGDDVIDDFVALSWMEWDGGALRTTATGLNICRQVRDALQPP